MSTFTDVTWENTPVVDRGKGLGWMAQADLQAVYAEVTGLPIEDARVLVSFAASGHPAQVTWDWWLQGMDQWEQTQTVAVIESVVYNPALDKEDPFRVHVRYPGFGPVIKGSQLVAVRALDTVLSFSEQRGPVPGGSCVR